MLRITQVPFFRHSEPRKQMTTPGSDETRGVQTVTWGHGQGGGQVREASRQGGAPGLRLAGCL